MSASMFSGEGNFMDVVRDKAKPHPPIQALQQGSVGDVMSDLQRMLSDERKQHEDSYRYEHGHNDGSAPGWRSSF